MSENNLIEIFKKKRKRTKESEKIGRKRIDDKDGKNKLKIGSHNKTSEDNIFYKIKVYCMKYIINLLNSILIKNNIPKQFMKIQGEIIRDGSKLFNILFFESKIKKIFLDFPISKKYKRKKSNKNDELIQYIEENNIQEIIEILDKTFYDIYENDFRKLNNKEYCNKYNIKINKFLYTNLNFDDETKKCLDDFMEYGIMKYLNKKNTRKIYQKKYREGLQ